ncbi:hypothetical protein [Alteromonas gracilis]|uniref:hypothetical protein n=1 Tax=Alteromonas gracilis TaxID=1479524 RepID=UPI003735DA36
MLQSKLSQMQGVTVVDLNSEDLNIDKLCYVFCKELDVIGSQKIVIDLSLVDVIIRAELHKLAALNVGLKMMGRKVIFCGLNPFTASVLLTFDADIPFDTELDVNHAIKTISHSS